MQKKVIFIWLCRKKVVLLPQICKYLAEINHFIRRIDAEISGFIHRKTKANDRKEKSLKTGDFSVFLAKNSNKFDFYCIFFVYFKYLLYLCRLIL